MAAESGLAVDALPEEKGEGLRVPAESKLAPEGQGLCSREQSHSAPPPVNVLCFGIRDYHSARFPGTQDSWVDAANDFT